jgi:hypothetical protein
MHLPGFLTRACLFVMLTGCAPAALAQDGIGTITRLLGGGILTSLGQMNTVIVGAPVHLDDIVSSDADARIEILFIDGTRLTIGEKASLRLDRYVFDPAGGGPGRLALFLQGAARYISGRLGRSPGGTVVVTTAFASITVRGTDFWAGPIDGGQGVFLLDGKIEVANGAGAVTLDETGEGTSIASPDAAPRAVTRWPAEKVDRALAATSF